MVLANDQPFVRLDLSALREGEIMLPSYLEGKWGVVLFYRGHW